MWFKYGLKGPKAQKQYALKGSKAQSVWSWARRFCPFRAYGAYLRKFSKIYVLWQMASIAS